MFGWIEWKKTYIHVESNIRAPDFIILAVEKG